MPTWHLGVGGISVDFEDFGRGGRRRHCLDGGRADRSCHVGYKRNHFPPVASCEVGWGAASVGALALCWRRCLGGKGFSRVASML